MPAHPALKEIVQALESLGVRVRDDYCYGACRACKKNRRWKPEEVAHKRVLNLLFCNACLSLQSLATTNKSEIIV